MATTVNELKATVRPKSGRGAARAERRSGKVPGVIYGDNQPPLSISVDHSELLRERKDTVTSHGEHDAGRRVLDGEAGRDDRHRDDHQQHLAERLAELRGDDRGDALGGQRRIGQVRRRHQGAEQQ